MEAQMKKKQQNAVELRTPTVTYLYKPMQERHSDQTENLTNGTHYRDASNQSIYQSISVPIRLRVRSEMLK